jgi:chromosome segregation ATPase
MRHQHWKILGELPAFPALLAIACTMAPASSQAQVQRSGGEAQKFMQQYQQLAQEKTALQSQVDKMKKDLDSAKADLAAMAKERDALKAHVGGSAAAIAQATASKNSAEKSLEAYKQKTEELIARFRETATSLKETEADRNRLHKELDERNAAYDKCAVDNLSLFEINSDLLNRYEHVGLFTKSSASEPFTRITRTRIENLVDEYRARAEEVRVKKQTP